MTGNPERPASSAQLDSLTVIDANTFESWGTKFTRESGFVEVPETSNTTRPGDIDLDVASNISYERRRHILDGDATGGGHGPGRYVPGKSEFPSQWSDDQTIANISDVVKDPNSQWMQQTGRSGAHYTNSGAPVRWRVEGTKEGVEIRVIVEPYGQGVVTAYPINIPPNP